MNTTSKIALVTGGAAGIGDSIVEALASDGALVYSLDLNECKAPRPGVTYLQGDVGNPESVSEAFAKIDRSAGGVDILVHNAGIQRTGLVGKLSFADWSSVLATHLNGFFLCASEAVPRMTSQKRGGSIIAISSAAAFVGLPGRAPYTAAKAGLTGLMRCLAVEVASNGIRVNAVAPGFTRTAIIEDAIANGSLQADWMLERVPMKRLAEPRELANVVKFLASDGASYVTGQTLLVDGGWTSQGINQAPDWLGAASARP